MSDSATLVIELAEGYELDEARPEGLLIRTTEFKAMPVSIPWELLRLLERRGLLRVLGKEEAGNSELPWRFGAVRKQP